MPNPDGTPTQAEIDDFVARNGGDTGGGGGRGDRGRAVEALTNDTSGRDFDSQGPMYDQRTNSLSAAGQAATMALRQRRAAMQTQGLYGLASPGGPSGFGSTGMSQGRGIILPPTRPSTMPTPPPLTTGGGRAIRDVNHPQYWSMGNQQALYFETGGREGNLGGTRETPPRGDTTGGLYQLAGPQGQL